MKKISKVADQGLKKKKLEKTKMKKNQSRLEGKK